jgi:hypothetical protein
MELLLTVCLGIGLSAACGFRIFIPFLVMSVASRAGHLDLNGGFDWLATDAALVTFSVATALEIAAYYVPWLDNLLDAAATPTAVVAGVLASAAAIDGASPLVTWTLAAVAGGGAAALIQTGTTILRGASSLLTAGFGNPLLATAEAGGALGLAALAIMVPVVALLVLTTVVLVAGVRTARALPGQRAFGRSPSLS